MSSANAESQKLVTQATMQLMEFDFTTIGGSAHVYLCTEHNEPSYYNFVDVQTNWVDNATHTFKRCDFEWSGLRSDLTGAIAEPSLKVAAVDLWNITEWASAISNMNMGLMDYRGLRVRRARKFYNFQNSFVAIQTYYVKTVDELSATTISFTLTPSLGSEQMDQPSARKLEL